ncbi:MAG: CBS domain-containing protein [Deltaproteobacteria bacterium]|nr:CBS domain-containing protein [Deltaproteobacteria bacterium]
MLDEIIQEEEQIAREREEDAARLGAAILQRPLSELAKLREPAFVGPKASIRQAIDRMKAQRAGCVLVEEGGRLIGIFTERDVLTKVVGTEIDLDKATVDTMMTADPESLGPDDKVSFALNTMSVRGFRHVPIVNDDDHPCGVVSMRDVVDYMVDLFHTEVLNLPPTPRLQRPSREGA